MIGQNAPKLNIRKACHDFTSKVNMLASSFSHCRIQTLRYLFSSFCTAFYGAPLWCLSNRVFDVFAVAWRKGVRRLLRLSPRTRSKLLPSIMECADIGTQIMCRLAGFICRLRESQNALLRISMSLLPTSSSILARNLTLLADRVRMTAQFVLGSAPLRHLRAALVHSGSQGGDDVEIAAGIIIEILDHNINGFLERDEILFLLNFLCHQDYG